MNGADSLCNQFSYLSLRKPGLFTTELETGYIIRRGGRLEGTQLFKNESVQAQLDFNAMALLDNNQVSRNKPLTHPTPVLVYPTQEQLMSMSWLCYSGFKAARVKVSVAFSNSFLFLGSRWAER